MDNINSKEGYVKDLRKQHQVNQVKNSTKCTCNICTSHFELQLLEKAYLLRLLFQSKAKFTCLLNESFMA